MRGACSNSAHALPEPRGFHEELCERGGESARAQADSSIYPDEEVIASKVRIEMRLELMPLGNIEAARIVAQ